MKRGIVDPIERLARVNRAFVERLANNVVNYEVGRLCAVLDARRTKRHKRRGRGAALCASEPRRLAAFERAKDLHKRLRNRDKVRTSTRSYFCIRVESTALCHDDGGGGSVK
eukprot:Amastigsp_a5093_7.p3 type:complete len:112 gc:universal Amastigsp_a5093_7:616-951(+)